METTIFIELLRSNAAGARVGRVLSGSEWGEILQTLASLEIGEGGPYALPAAEVSQLSAIEIQEKNYAFNSAISVFLSSHGIVLPNLENYLKEKNLEEAAMLSGIRELAQLRCAELPPEMNEKANFVVERTLTGNPDKQMPLMAYYFRKALGTLGTEFSDEFIAKLGLANVYFWTAFIIYDDLWDEDETGDPALLPIANLFARHYIATFSAMLPGTGFQEFFHVSMDLLDSANNWETKSCRMTVRDSEVTIQASVPTFGFDNAINDYEKKYQPVAGHIMGPLVMLLMLGYSLESDEANSMIGYFKHYLIAMQLNDDLHDWKEDLQRGHISTTVAKLITCWKERNPGTKEISLEKDMPELEQIFWFKVLEPLCQSILTQANASRKALYSLKCIEDATPLEKYITKNEEAAHKALAEKKWSDDLLQSLNPSI